MKIDINYLKSKNQNHFEMTELISGIEDIDFNLLENIKFDFTVDFLNDEVLIKGNFEALVELNCVRCLNSYKSSIKAEVEGYYLDSKAFIKYTNSQEAELESKEIAYEPIINGQIDLRELVREHLILEMDPYGVCSDQCLGLEELKKYSEDDIDPRWLDLLEMSKKIN